MSNGKYSSRINGKCKSDVIYGSGTNGKQAFCLFYDKFIEKNVIPGS